MEKKSQLKTRRAEIVGKLLDVRLDQRRASLELKHDQSVYDHVEAIIAHRLASILDFCRNLALNVRSPHPSSRDIAFPYTASRNP